MAVSQQTVADVAALITDDPEVIREWGSAKPFHADLLRMRWVNPDTWYMETGAVPFIFTADGNIFYGWNETVTHGEIIALSRELWSRFKHVLGANFWNDFGGPPVDDPLDEGLSDAPVIASSAGSVCPDCGGSIEPGRAVCSRCDRDNTGDSDSGFAWRDKICNLALLGRISPNRQTASFWNEDPEQYEQLLGNCVQKLISDGKLDPNGEVSTPVHRTVPVSELSNVKAQELTDEERAQVKLWQKLHLLRGDAKKIAMKQLGVGWDQQTQHPWAKAMKDAGTLTPGAKWWAPTSEETISQIASAITDDPSIINEWEEEEEEEERDGKEIEVNLIRYINPNKFYGDRHSTSFIYTTEGKVYYANGSWAHFEMAESNSELIIRYRRRDMRLVGDILGRIGYFPYVDYNYRTVDIRVMSIWNHKEEDYKNLPQCIQQLIKDGKITSNDCISTPVPNPEGYHTYPIADVEGLRLGVMSADDRAEVALWRKLHLLPPDQKRAAMRQLGLIGDTPDYSKHPWQSGAEKSGLINPGQKWWAPQSEGVVAQVASFLTDDPDVIVS
jgi:hypothetical protein